MSRANKRTSIKENAPKLQRVYKSNMRVHTETKTLNPARRNKERPKLQGLSTSCVGFDLEIKYGHINL